MNCSNFNCMLVSKHTKRGINFLERVSVQLLIALRAGIVNPTFAPLYNVDFDGLLTATDVAFSLGDTVLQRGCHPLSDGSGTDLVRDNLVCVLTK
jgi:hypothetical protein